MNVRATAAKIISQLLENQCSLSQILPKFKEQCKTKEEASLLQALCFGVLRWYPRLQFFAAQLLQKPMKEKDSDVYHLICLGLFQLTWMRIPAHAAISETVEATKDLNKPWAKGLVNAILRHYQRQFSDLQTLLDNDESALTAHPVWLLNHIKQSFPLHWQEIVEANNTQAPLVLRVHLGKISREEYLTLLQKEGYNAESLMLHPTAIKITPPSDVKNLPGYSAGLFSIQDGSGQFAAPLLNLAPGLRVLDACSAPGGKLGHILETEPKAQVIALDIKSEGTALIKENLHRLQLNATVLTADANAPQEWWDGILFDRILCDAPCSASGIIRRHPDIKLLRNQNDIARLNEEQSKLLQTLWSLLKPGGILLYATCSIFPEENQNIIEQFLKAHSEAHLLPFTLPCGVPLSIGHQFLPGQNDMDGFYYARMEKKHDSHIE